MQCRTESLETYGWSAASEADISETPRLVPIKINSASSCNAQILTAPVPKHQRKPVEADRREGKAVNECVSKMGVGKKTLAASLAHRRRSLWWFQLFFQQAKSRLCFIKCNNMHILYWNVLTIIILEWSDKRQFLVPWSNPVTFSEECLFAFLL